MIERFFYETLSEELTKRGFFVATEHAPENCVGICGINGTEKRVKYVKYLQKHYRLAAIKNIIFSIGNDGSGECAGGWYEVLVGSRTKEPFPMIFITLQYNERYYKMAYQCQNIRNFIRDNDGKEATRYIVECIKFMTSSLMDVLHEWISEGKFPLHRFAEGSEDIITEDRTMKQCKPLKEPLHVPKECAPCLPGLRNRRCMNHDENPRFFSNEDVKKAFQFPDWPAGTEVVCYCHSTDSRDTIEQIAQQCGWKIVKYAHIDELPIAQLYKPGQVIFAKREAVEWKREPTPMELATWRGQMLGGLRPSDWDKFKENNLKRNTKQ